MIIRELLMSAFYQFDWTILRIVHEFASNGGIVLKQYIKIFDIIGNSSLVYLIVVIVLFFVLKNKKYAYLFAISFVVSVILNNIIIKNYVMRPRPFQTNIEDYISWWQYAGSMVKDGYSFVSGHTIRAVACLYSIYLENRSIKYLIFVILFSFMTIISRLFFVVHYPSDCLFGIIFGVIVAYVVYFFVNRYHTKFDYIAKKIFPFAFKL